jgi:hypothetical protein
LLAAKSIGYSRGCSGAHAAEGIAKLGIAEQLKPKTLLAENGPVVEYLAKGDFDLGIQQTNIMVGAPGTEYVGPLPDFLNDPCPSSVALLTISKEPEATRAMIRFIASPEAAPLLRKTYAEPAGQRAHGRLELCLVRRVLPAVTAAAPLAFHRPGRLAVSDPHVFSAIRPSTHSRLAAKSEVRLVRLADRVSA